MLQKCWRFQRVNLVQRSKSKTGLSCKHSSRECNTCKMIVLFALSMSSWCKGKALHIWLTFIHGEVSAVSSSSCSLEFVLWVISVSVWVTPSDPTCSANSTGTWPFAPVLWLWFVDLKCSRGQWGKLAPGPWTPQVRKSFPCEGSFLSRVKSRTLTRSS